MKDHCLELVSQQKTLNAKLNIMREYLQAYLLRILYNDGVFRSTAFLGGTALRFLYGLPRFSEDLDFSLIKNKRNSFVNIVKKVKHQFLLAGYEISITYNDEKIVKYAFLKFSGLLYEAGLSSLKKQNFSIKIELDTNPPDGAVLKTDIVNKYFPMAFLSYDLPSLFARKINAILTRKYTKGRDFFDLGWYLSKWKDLTPNIILLHNGLRQTGWKKNIPDEKNWRMYLKKVVEKTDWKKVEKDVINFLENPSDMKIFTQDNILNLLQ